MPVCLELPRGWQQISEAKLRAWCCYGPGRSCVRGGRLGDAANITGWQGKSFLGQEGFCSGS